MHRDDLQGMLDSYGLGDRFRILQADALELECVECGDTVRAETVDVHVRSCDGA